MLKCTVLITRKGQLSNKDDVITIESVAETSRFFSVSYKTPESKNVNAFFASESQVLDYVEDIFSSLALDVDAFENIQVSTCIHPSVIYRVSDLRTTSLDEILLNMVRSSMRFEVVCT
jgi:hypothetical protein